MTQLDEEFLEKLRATFAIEAQEHVQAMSSALLGLEKLAGTEESSQQIEATFRHAHSLKGAARAVNFAAVEGICQALEDVLAAWKRREITPSAAFFDSLHRAIDQIGNLLLTTAKEPSSDDDVKTSSIIQQLGKLLSDEAITSAQEGQGTNDVAQVPEIRRSEAAEHASEIGSLPGAGQTPSESRVFAETVRVSAAKLDRVLLEAEEMLMVKQSFAQRAADLRQVQALFEQGTRQLGKLEKQIPAVQIEFVRLIEGKLRALEKTAAEDRHFIIKLVDDLLANSKELLMLPFSTLAEVFPKSVRDLSRYQAKEADLVVRGGDVEIDKRILEEMKDALTHLVRNCIDHGVEKPGERAAQKKPSRATITIAVAPMNGNKVEILVSDDGAGIDLRRVKESALKRGIISAEEAKNISDEKATDLIFQSEVSTSPMITEISGRGLGLAIVREKTEKLGGRVVVESQRHVGTNFRIILPLTLATFRGIVVRAAGQRFVIPNAMVERVARVKNVEIRTVENRETISLRGCAVSFVRLEQILEIESNEPGNQAAAFVSLVVLGTGDQQIAFGVDEVLDEQEVLVKSLGKPLSRVRNIAGATILASGKVIPILNGADLMKSATKINFVSRREPEVSAPKDEKLEKRKVLLAEDSITSRLLVKGILESAGYEVKTAVDGVEAWTILRTEEFDVVVSDVEMPRMNGFDLTAHIRGDKRLAAKPVVLVTALASKEHREQGIDVGADAYIVKSNFDQSNLLDVIRRLVG